MKMYKRNDAIHFTIVNDEVIMIDLENSKYYGLNSMAAFIWKKLEMFSSTDSIHGALLEKYNVDELKSKEKLESFIQLLVVNQLVLEEDN
ncbi:MAG: hypothetical protein RL634_350 [Bacteroidota bacterium]|jgi:hypothetical protein|nr:PqqD family protein [Chitinophagia bacterium]